MGRRGSYPDEEFRSGSSDPPDFRRFLDLGIRWSIGRRTFAQSDAPLSLRSALMSWISLIFVSCAFSSVFSATDANDGQGERRVRAWGLTNSPQSRLDPPWCMMSTRFTETSVKVDVATGYESKYKQLDHQNADQIEIPHVSRGIGTARTCCKATTKYVKLTASEQP